MRGNVQVYNPPTVQGRATVRFKIADNPSEFDQIAGLLYRTFVEEIPQHSPNSSRRHVDRFHKQNIYLVAKAGDDVVGTIAVRGVRPFSLDQKLGSVDTFLPKGRRVCELRLLAVEPAFRSGQVFRGLVGEVVREGRSRGYDLAIISGTTRQTKLYRHLGFEPFGPLVGGDDARFQPMYLTFEKFLSAAPKVVSEGEPMSFLPGPVPLAQSVRDAFAKPPVYHRDAEFQLAFGRTKARLCRLSGTGRVEILVGTGTLANDAVAAQLSLLESPGVILSNGEFGQRLIDHARRHRLPHVAIESPWGHAFDLAAASEAVERTRATWMWAVVSETSTGMLNDLAALKAVAARRRVKLCLDCVSAIGAVPLNLSGVYLASGASGKALASYPGLSFVFYDHEIAPQPERLPRYIDIGYYASKDGVPFTHSSNLLGALDAALERFDTDEPFAKLNEFASLVRPGLRRLGWEPLVEEPLATPAVITVALTNGYRAKDIGASLEKQGLVVAHHSEYLASRNWFQVSLMGHRSAAPFECLLAALGRLVHH
ncbi:MAG TPA: GNAT family N-acetyltransferase [Vicinamibacterales bacterium]|nr:GNAT family N-acetyltransferase [Vicinamibacterales bacterium]